MSAFSVIAKLKFLRGTALDIFGYSEERRIERSLPVDYRATISALLPQLSKDNLSKAVAIASIPEDIRGYGHVKERHLAAAHAKQNALLASFKETQQQAKQVA